MPFNLKIRNAKEAKAFKLGWTRYLRQVGALVAVSLALPIKSDGDVFTAAEYNAFANFVNVQINIRDYGAIGDGVTNDTAAVQDTIDAATAGETVVIPPGDFYIPGTVTVPDGVHLRIQGDIIGLDSNSKFVIQGTSRIEYEGGWNTNVSTVLQSGSPQIFGLKYTGYVHTAGILIQGTSTYTNVVIKNWVFKNCNYGILRQGAGSSLTGAIIQDGFIQDIRGDGVEWNLAVNDSNILVDTIEIDGIDSTVTGNPNWGIGIGFAGSGYNDSYLEANAVKDFIISNIVGRRCRNLVHVEIATRFRIHNIRAKDISTAYSTTSGLDNRTIQVNGGWDFSVSEIDALDSGAIATEFGVSGGAFLMPCRNYSFSDIRATNTVVFMDSGNPAGLTSKVEGRNIVVDGSLFRFWHRPTHVTLHNIVAHRTRASGPAVELLFDRNLDSRQAYRELKRATLDLRRVQGYDEWDADNVSVDSIAQQRADVRDLNKDYSTVAPTTVNRVLHGASNGLPYGIEFHVGDVFIDTTTPTQYVFTAGGSLNRASDTFSVVDAANRIVRSTNLAWTNPFQHYVGQRITLSNIGPASASLVTTVVRTFISAGQFRMELSDAISAADGTTGTITATVAPTYATV